jgi:hypothetical protein
MNITLETIHCVMLNRDITKSQCIEECILWDNCEQKLGREGILIVLWDWIKNLVRRKNGTFN